MKTTSHFIMVVLLLLTVCCEERSSDLIWISIPETQCANPWDSFEGITAEDRVSLYLSSESIDVQDVVIEDLIDDSVVFCAACTCGTGRVVHALIEEGDIKKAESLGFVVRESD